MRLHSIYIYRSNMLHSNHAVVEVVSQVRPVAQLDRSWKGPSASAEEAQPALPAQPAPPTPVQGAGVSRLSAASQAASKLGSPLIYIGRYWTLPRSIETLSFFVSGSTAVRSVGQQGTNFWRCAIDEQSCATVLHHERYLSRQRIVTQRQRQKPPSTLVFSPCLAPRSTDPHPPRLSCCSADASKNLSLDQIRVTIRGTRQAMAGFNPQPDEGYSEDPLTALSAAPPFSFKSREDAVSALGSARSRDEFPSWLVEHISSLSLARKTGKSRRLLVHLSSVCCDA